jgi:hypothetical protein
VRGAESGFHVPGQTRDIAALRTARGTAYLVARNNDRPLLFRPMQGKTVALSSSPQRTRKSALSLGVRTAENAENAEKTKKVQSSAFSAFSAVKNNKQSGSASSAVR